MTIRFGSPLDSLAAKAYAVIVENLFLALKSIASASTESRLTTL